MRPRLSPRLCQCDPVSYRGAARVYLFDPPTDAGCWKCTHGLIPISRTEADTTEETLIVVHHRMARSAPVLTE